MARFLYAVGPRTGASQTWPRQPVDALWVDLGPEDRAQVEAYLNRLYPANPAAVAAVLEGTRQRAVAFDEGEAVACALTHFEGFEEDWPQDLAAGVRWAASAGGRPRPRPLVAHRLSLFLGRRFLLTYHPQDPNPAVSRAFDTVRANRVLAQGVDMALYHLLLSHWERLDALYQHILAASEALNEALLQYPRKDLTAHILAVRRRILEAIQVVRPEVDVYRLFQERSLKQIDPALTPYFRQLAWRVEELHDDLLTRLDALEGAVEAYSSLQSNEINKVMQFLTVLSVLALPATTIASIYGMNFRIPEVGWPAGYWYSLVLMALVTALLLVMMRRRGWWR